MNPKLSVIIPVYHAEKYLNRCVDRKKSKSKNKFVACARENGCNRSCNDIRGYD